MEAERDGIRGQLGQERGQNKSLSWVIVQQGGNWVGNPKNCSISVIRDTPRQQ